MNIFFLPQIVMQSLRNVSEYRYLKFPSDSFKIQMFPETGDLFNWRQYTNFFCYFCIGDAFFRGIKYESEVTQSCPTLCDPMDCSLPGSSVHGIFQAWIPEWVAISFSSDKIWRKHKTLIYFTCEISKFQIYSDG